MNQTTPQPYVPHTQLMQRVVEAANGAKEALRPNPAASAVSAGAPANSDVPSRDAAAKIIGDLGQLRALIVSPEYISRIAQAAINIMESSEYFRDQVVRVLESGALVGLLRQQVGLDVLQSLPVDPEVQRRLANEQPRLDPAPTAPAIVDAIKELRSPPAAPASKYTAVLVDGFSGGANDHATIVFAPRIGPSLSPESITIATWCVAENHQITPFTPEADVLQAIRELFDRQRTNLTFGGQYFCRVYLTTDLATPNHAEAHS